MERFTKIRPTSVSLIETVGNCSFMRAAKQIGTKIKIIKTTRARSAPNRYAKGNRKAVIQQAAPTEANKVKVTSRDQTFPRNISAIPATMTEKVAPIRIKTIEVQYFDSTIRRLAMGVLKAKASHFAESSRIKVLRIIIANTMGIIAMPAAIPIMVLKRTTRKAKIKMVEPILLLIRTKSLQINPVIFLLPSHRIT